MILAGVWYFYFIQDISLPDKRDVQRIEVFQNDFRQHVQQLTYIEEKDKIDPICDFLKKREKGWQPLLYTPPPPVAYADFYGAKGILFQLAFMNSSNFLIHSGNGNYLKSLRNKERTEFMDLLGLRKYPMEVNGDKTSLH